MVFWLWFLTLSCKALFLTVYYILQNVHFVLVDSALKLSAKMLQILGSIP